MAQKFVHYYADDATAEFGVAVEENVIQSYPIVVQQHGQASGTIGSATMPTLYDTLALLQVDFPTAIAKPAALSLRGLTLDIPGFGGAFMPVLDNRPFKADDATVWGGQLEATQHQWGFSGAAPFPKNYVEDQLEIDVTGYRGESRATN